MVPAAACPGTAGAACWGSESPTPHQPPGTAAADARRLRQRGGWIPARQVLKDPGPWPGRSRCDGRSARSDCRRADHPSPEEGSHPTSP